MANYATLKAAIQNVVKTNGNNEITGALLQQTLLTIVNSLGVNYQFVGIATTSTNPGTPDENVAYLAGPGTYTNFNSLVVPVGKLGVLKYNGSWVVQTVDVGKNYDSELAELAQKIDGFWTNLNDSEISFTSGAINVSGGIATFGYRSPIIHVSKGTYVYMKNFGGTPSYAIISKWANGSFERVILAGSFSFPNYPDYYYIFDDDMDVVFSASSQNIKLLINNNYFIDYVLAKNELFGAQIQELSGRIKIIFCGFAIDTQTSKYVYDRTLTIDGYNLSVGSCFIVQMGVSLYPGYTDTGHDGGTVRKATLNVSNTGAKPLFLNGIRCYAKNSWLDNELLLVYYDGTNYIATGYYGLSGPDKDFNRVNNVSSTDLFANSTQIDDWGANYAACLVHVNAGDLLFIRTSSTTSIPIISKKDGDNYTVLEYGATRFSGYYDSGTLSYVYVVKEEMDLRIIYFKNFTPIIISVNSFLSWFIKNADANITTLLQQIATKASVADLNLKASTADLTAERQARIAADEALGQRIDDIQIPTDIEQYVNDYLNAHPELIQSIADNSITESKFTESVRHKKASTYPTVAAMVADSTLEIGMYANTTGYYSENDGGGGKYYISNTGTQNGGDCILLGNGLYAKLIYDGRTFKLRQWGIRGDNVIRTAKTVFPFLTSSDILAVNPSFDDSVTDAAYIIQYLMKNKVYVNAEIVIDVPLAFISHSLIPASFVTIRGLNTGAPRNSWGRQAQQPENEPSGYRVPIFTKSTLIMTKANIPMFHSSYYGTQQNQVIQFFNLRDFNASGIFGMVGFYSSTPGHFWDSTNLVMSRCCFERLNLFNFKNAFNIIEECDWCIWDTLLISNMQDNGIYMPAAGMVTTIDNGQKNANTIRYCIIESCGHDYDANGNKINVYGANYDNNNNPITSPIDAPTHLRGNAIVVSHSGNVIMNCDCSACAVGVFRCQTSESTTVIGTYSETISMAQIYDDYTTGNQYSVVVGGYLRTDTWKDSNGVIKNNLRQANPTNF